MPKRGRDPHRRVNFDIELAPPELRPVLHRLGLKVRIYHYQGSCRMWVFSIGRRELGSWIENTGSMRLGTRMAFAATPIEAVELFGELVREVWTDDD